MSPKKVAVFGSSHVCNLQGYCRTDGLNLGEDVTVRFFGQGGTRAEEVYLGGGRCQYVVNSLIRFQPDIIVIMLGGNDITCTSSPGVIYFHLREVVRQFQSTGAYVIVGELLTRQPSRYHTPGLTKEIYDFQRTKVNKKLRHHFVNSYIDLRVKFPSDFVDSDLIHLNNRGMLKICRYLRRRVLKVITSIQ